MKKVIRKGQAGFTLIEMLLVVAVLAVVGIMAVTKFGGAEKEALAVAAAHNPMIVQQTADNFKSLYSVYPSKWHTGLHTDQTKSVEGLGLQAALNMASDASGAIPEGSIKNDYDKGYQVLVPGSNVKALSAGQVRALRDNGIHQLKVGGYAPVSESLSVPSNLDTDVTTKAWVLDEGKELYRGGTAVQQPDWSYVYTRGTEVVEIDRKPLSDWDSWGEAVVLLACTKDVDWKGVLRGDPDAKGMGEFLKNSQIELPKPPKDPKAKAASAFPYYWAVFYLSPDQVDGSGYSADLLGVLDGELNVVS